MIKFLRTVFGAILLCLVTTIHLYAQGANDTLPITALKQILRQDTDARNCGAVIMEQHNGHKNYFTQGQATPGQPVNDSTVFNIGSCSKTYLAALLLILQDSGKLRIDDPVNKYFTSGEIKISDKVTIRSLLNHTSGLPDYETPDAFIKALTSATDHYTDKDIFRFVKHKKRHTAPGTYSYNNLGYCILGWVAEQAAQVPLEVAFRKYLFSRLQLQHTFFYAPQDQTNVALPGYELLYPNEPKLNRINLNNLTFSAGNIYTNAHELNRFITSLFLDKTLISSSALGQMQEILMLNEKNQYGIGLGVYSTMVRGKKMLSHTGRLLMGYTAVYACFPELNYTVVILRNNMILDYNSRMETFNEIILQLLDLRFPETRPAKEHSVH